MIKITQENSETCSLKMCLCFACLDRWADRTIELPDRESHAGDFLLEGDHLHIEDLPSHDRAGCVLRVINIGRRLDGEKELEVSIDGDGGIGRIRAKEGFSDPSAIRVGGSLEVIMPSLDEQMEIIENTDSGHNGEARGAPQVNDAKS